MSSSIVIPYQHGKIGYFRHNSIQLRFKASAYHHIYTADRSLPTPGLVYVNWAAQKPQKGHMQPAGRGLAITGIGNVGSVGNV